MDPLTLLLGVALFAGLYVAWNIGANDVANVVGFSIGTRALTIRRAIVVALVFEIAGALLCGGRVTRTVAEGIVDVGNTHTAGAIAMTVALVVAAAFLHVGTRYGWPISTTHGMLGALVGSGVAFGGFGAAKGAVFASIAAGWVVAPLSAGVIGFIVFRGLQRFVLDQARPLVAIQRAGPWLVAPIVAALALVVARSDSRFAAIDVPPEHSGLLAIAIGLVSGLASVPFFRSIRDREGAPRRGSSDGVERAFLGLQGLTVCALAFAHGSNEVAQAVGPMAAVASTLRLGGGEPVAISANIVLVGAVGLAVGLLAQGPRAMQAMTDQVTELTPSRGFVAELSAMFVVLGATHLGVPISVTHTLVGAVVGVAFARSIGALNLNVLRAIALSWAVSVPVTAAVSIAVCALLRTML